MKVELRAHDQHRAQLGAAHRGASLRRAAVARSPCARKDGFAFSLDVSQIIHIGMKNAPRVISRVGSMQNLVDHVLQPTVANYFRNSAQEVTVLEFLSARSERQQQAYDDIRRAVEAYDVECIDTLIGDIVPPAELMKTQTDRKIADELQRTYEVQREAQVQAPGAGARDRGRQHAGRGGAQRAGGAHRRAPRRCRSPRRPRARPRALRAARRRRGRRATPACARDAPRPRRPAPLGAAKADAYREGVERARRRRLHRHAARRGAGRAPGEAGARHRGRAGPAGSGLAEVLIARMLAATTQAGPRELDLIGHRRKSETPGSQASGCRGARGPN